MHLHLLVKFANVSFCIKPAKIDGKAGNHNLCLSVNLAVCFVCLFLLMLYDHGDDS